MSCSSSAKGAVAGAEASAAAVRPRRPVVTAFVRREDGKLLVVKRSEKVSSYRHQWGGVSGGVEGSESLLHRALTEIVEETGLTPQQLQLVAFGRPLPVDDPGRRRFLVHPFLFQLTDEAAAVILNWENEAYDWVTPSALAQLHHVPLLPETLRRLLLPPYMQMHVQYIKTDRQHGASELSAYVLQALRAAIAHEERSAPSSKCGTPSTTAAAAATSPLAAEAQAEAAVAAAAAEGSNGSSNGQQQQHAVYPSFEACMEAYQNFCFHMAVARPSMAAVANSATNVMLQLQQEVAARADPFEPAEGVARVALTDALNKLTQQLQQQQASVITNGAAVLKGGMTVLTTSLSSTVAKVLIQAHQQALAAAATAADGDAAAAAALAEHMQRSGELGTASAAAAAAAADQAVISAGIAQGAAGSIDLLQQVPAAAAAAAAAAAGSSVVKAGQLSIAMEDWIDDPEFWPSSSGIGRDALAAPSSSSSSRSRWELDLVRGRQQQQQQQHSSSSSVSKGPGLSVIVCESRPLCEGVSMARRLAAAGLNVTLITDAQAGVFVEQADVVLLGADAVTPDGVVNKVGSRLLALAAKAAGVPVVAVTECLKVSPGPVSAAALPNTSLQEGEEEKEASEVLQGWSHEAAAAVTKLMVVKEDSSSSSSSSGSAVVGSNGAGESAGGVAAGSSSSSSSGGDASVLAAAGPGSIDVRNVYFEAVPLQYVTGLVTDKGFVSRFVVAQMIKQRARDYQQAFGLEVVGGPAAV
uniref:Nudix hydrolase domain-containing protein n=1 Tax=Tetradesmus obliquus TaxID=3088 RepID=A0A383WBQ4_TETOB|eukprot:jgi/Sobl393_1/11115/SZX74622.1